MEQGSFDTFKIPPDAEKISVADGFKHKCKSGKCYFEVHLRDYLCGEESVESPKFQQAIAGIAKPTMDMKSTTEAGGEAGSNDSGGGKGKGKEKGKEKGNVPGSSPSSRCLQSQR